MRYWKTMVAGGAAMLISVGSARAVEHVDGATASARREMTRDGGEAYGAAPMKADAMGGDASGYVTRDELEEYSKELVQRLEQQRNAQIPEPTFTDAG